MATADKKRDGRLEIRIRDDLKQELERACALQGSTLTQFVLSSALKAARDTVEQHQRLKLNHEQSVRFAAALTRKPRKLPALARAVKRAKGLRRES